MLLDGCVLFIVDDNFPTRRILKASCLKDLKGVCTYEMETGLEAVYACRKVLPDVVVMDYMMPSMNGVEATKIIKKVHPEAIIIGFTGINEKGLEDKFILAGAETVVSKPLDKDKRELVTSYIKDALVKKLEMQNVNDVEEAIKNEQINCQRVEVDYEKLEQDKDKIRSRENLGEIEKQFLVHVPEVKTSAQEYIQSIGGESQELIDALEELNCDLYSKVIGYEDDKSQYVFYEVLDLFREYGHTIGSLMDFAHIEYAIDHFVKSLEDAQYSDIENKYHAFMVTVLTCLLDDLQEWKNRIFIDQDTPDIHFLDHSLVSSCIQIVNMVTGVVPATNEEDEEDDIDFF